ncbi:MAG: Glycosyltransferase, GT2 family [Candidatus Nitrotoga sp. LAW]|nr:MAG: Glycosyltransferase, GT2 family [Candidatus Nitrotoga sp. LAW]
MTEVHNPLVYVLILNYCSLNDTIGCIESVRCLDYPNFRLLVIDNASTDGSGIELAKKLPDSEFLQLPINIGYAGGNNEGIRIALDKLADYVFIINPDVRLPPDCLRNYLSVFDSDNSIGALNSIQLTPDGRSIDPSFLSGVLGPAGYPTLCVGQNDYPNLFETKTLFGAALIISSRALRKVGGFDPLYFAYGEEIDLCRRIMFHGLRLMVTTRSPVIHLRTNYSKPLSSFILFLKLKGYYLSQLKSPFQPLSISAPNLVRTFWAAFFGRANGEYPFNSYPISRAVIIRAAWWFILHAYRVWLHRRIEMAGRAHV